jgi:DNA-binding NarL/FixJ family response regulator
MSDANDKTITLIHRRLEQPARVLIVHLDRLVGESLAAALTGQRQTIQVVGCIRTVAHLQRTPPQANLFPDVILLGSRGGAGTTTRAARQLQTVYDGTPILVFESELSDVYPDTGRFAIGSVPKSSSLRGLVKKIQLLAGAPTTNGQVPRSGPVLPVVPLINPVNNAVAWNALTRREEEVWMLRQKGLNNKDIASSLKIGVQTVKNHMHVLSLKLRL